MALLIVECGGKMRGGVIAGRVVIGRRPQDQIRLRDKSVAHIHAWIGIAPDGSHFIADAGSKIGTWVNDRRVSGRMALNFHDRIRIGPLLMRLEEGHNLPAGALPIDLRVRESPPPSKKNGISFDCACGAPIWTPWSRAGEAGRCRACGERVSVPLPAGFGRGGAKTAHCGVCHGEIQAPEKTARCPECGAVFHMECWTENGGCSVYGCSQVGAISAPPAKDAGADENDASNLMPDEAAGGNVVHAIPWASLLLAASVIGALMGTLTFGGTSVFVMAASMIYLWRIKPLRQRRMVYLSIAVSIIGAVAGGIISHYWWTGVGPWHPRR